MYQELHMYMYSHVSQMSCQVLLSLYGQTEPYRSIAINRQFEKEISIQYIIMHIYKYCMCGQSTWTTAACGYTEFQSTLAKNGWAFSSSTPAKPAPTVDRKKSHVYTLVRPQWISIHLLVYIHTSQVSHLQWVIYSESFTMASYY